MILPQFPGHLDKRFNIATRGEADEVQDEDTGEAGSQALQRGVQATGVGACGTGRRGDGGQGSGTAGGSLYAWRSKARLISQSSQEQRLEQSEQARLKREVTRLEEENAFLKKAAAYFAKQPQ